MHRRQHNVKQNDFTESESYNLPASGSLLCQNTEHRFDLSLPCCMKKANSLLHLSENSKSND